MKIRDSALEFFRETKRDLSLHPFIIFLCYVPVYFVLFGCFILFGIDNSLYGLPCSLLCYSFFLDHDNKGRGICVFKFNPPLCFPNGLYINAK